MQKIAAKQKERTPRGKTVPGVTKKIIKRLKDSGLYRPERELQASMLARVIVMLDKLEKESGLLVSSEISREGNERLSVSPYMLAFEKLHNMALRDLRALGMNADSRPDKPAGKDSLADFMTDIINH